MGSGARLAKAGNRRVNQRRVFIAQFRAKTKTAGNAGSEVFNDNVALQRNCFCRGLRRRIFQIQHKRLLSTVHQGEQRTFAMHEWADMAVIVALWRL